MDETFDYSLEEEKRPNVKLDDHWEFGFNFERRTEIERKPRSLDKLFLDEIIVKEEEIVKEGWMERRVGGFISDWEVKIKLIKRGRRNKTRRKRRIRWRMRRRREIKNRK